MLCSYCIFAVFLNETKIGKTDIKLIGFERVPNRHLAITRFLKTTKIKLKKPCHYKAALDIGNYWERKVGRENDYSTN